MIPSRLTQSLRDANPMAWCVGAAAASVAAVLMLTVGLSAARSSPVGSSEGAARVAAVTKGDLREAALKALVARMDPASAALAQRFDPQAFVAQTPLYGFPAGDPALQQLQLAEGAEARRLNAAIPFAADGGMPATPFFLQARSPAERERAVRCLTNAIYYEAALEPEDGQRAVAQVVLNRMRNPNFPKSICGVVYQGWEKLTGCQFSFTCDGALVREPLAVLWRDDRKIAEAALNGYVMPQVGNSTHYHADYVSPYWAPQLVKVSQIGAHIFYRWPGQAGEPRNFTAAYAGGELSITDAILSGRAARAAAPPQTVAALGPIDGGPGLPGLPGLRNVAMADGKGGVQTRVTGSFDAAPAQYGRRAPTPDEIARINALLEQRFPTKPAEPAAAPATPPAEPVPAVGAG